MGSATSQMSTYDPANASGNNTDVGSDELRSEIESTRSGMSETVDAIQAKLSPQNVQDTAEQITERAKQAALEVSEQAIDRLKETVTQIKNEVKGEIHDATIGRVERMVGNVKNTTRDASSSILETIKANPIPSALVGIGLAWLFMNKSSSSSSSDQRYYPQGYNSAPQGYAGYGGYAGYNEYSQYGQGGARFQNQGSSGYGAPSTAEKVQQKAGEVVDNVQEKAGQVVDNVTEAAGHVKDKAGEFVNQTQAQVGQFADRVQDRAQRVMTRSQSMIEDNPLMTSALALTLGAAVGLLLPETQRENELMGEARDKFVGQVSEAAQGTMEKAQRVASEVLHEAGENVKEEAKKQGLTGNSSSTSSTSAASSRNM